MSRDVGILIALWSAGCGGGGGAGPAPPAVPSFTISVSPASVTVAQGGSAQSVQVSVSGQGGFSSAVTITVSGLPSGVTASPALSVNAGSAGALTFSASGLAQIAAQTVTIQGSSGNLSANTSLQLEVTGQFVADPFHAVGGVIVHGFYDESRQLLFATNPGLNELDVISGQDFAVKARVPLPQPWGIDQMADGKTLIIGTKTQSIVTVDEDTLAVAQYPFSAVANFFFTLFFPNVVAMANGKALIIGQAEGVDSSDILDGGQALYEWDSNTKTFSLLPGVGANGSAGFEVDSLARSGDHKWAVFSADQFYLYSSDLDSLSLAPLTAVNPPQNTFGVRGYALNGDASKIAVVSATSVTFLNRSFGVLGTTAIPGAFQTGRTAVVFSTDGNRLFLQYDLPIGIEEIDANSYSLLGYVSAVVAPENNEERLLATDSTGRAFVGIAGGVRLATLNAPVPNLATDVNFPIPNCSMPTLTLPLNQSSQVQVLTSVQNVSMYVGGEPATVASSSTGATITIPASAVAGPADVECIGSNGNTSVIAADVSYGVAPAGASASLLPPSANASVILFGFGFSVNQSAPSVTVAGRNAVTTASGSANFGALQFAKINAPTGTPGSPGDIVVSSSVGTGVLPGAITYFPSSTIVPATGLLQILFDRGRNQLYGLKANEVDVLNASTLKWQASLSLPQVGGTTSYDVMALSPEGAWLLAASSDGHVVVVNPDQPAQASVVTLNAGNLTGPVAISKLDKAVFAGLNAVELDLATLASRTLGINTGQLIRSSADGSHLYGADLNVTSGALYSIDPSTYSVKSEQFGQLFWTDLTVSSDGTQVAGVDAPPFATGDIVGFFNAPLQLLNTNAYPDFSPPDDTGVLGSTFSPAGKVLVVALGDSIEFWDTATGRLRGRLMTPEELHVLVYPEGPVAPAIALDGTGQTIYAISASGISVLQLAQPLDQLPAVTWPETLNAHPRVVQQGSIASRMAAWHGTTQN